MKRPLVSVVITTYNQAQFLGEAVQSVCDQTLRDYETLIIDNGSDDRPAEVASRFRHAKFIRQGNVGAAGGRNRGMRESRGSHLIFLDADDRLLPNALELGVKALNAHPECAFTSGHCGFISANGCPESTVEPPCTETDYYAALLRACYIWCPAVVMFRRPIIEAFGGFHGDSFTADYDLYLRIAKELPIHCHHELVAQRRLHSSNISNDNTRMLRSYLDVLGSQKKYVRENPKYSESYNCGFRMAQRYYGERALNDLLVHIRNWDWHRALEAMRVLLLYYPLGLACRGVDRFRERRTE